MDDLSQKLAGIINDPESMEKVRKMAESIFSDEEEKKTEANDSTPNLGDLLGGVDLELVMNLMSKLNSSQDDERTRLLTSLKPYLSEKRQEKTENAIKILKLLELLPLIKDSGLFKL